MSESPKHESIRVPVEQFGEIELVYQNREYRVVERENGIQLKRIEHE